MPGPLTETSSTVVVAPSGDFGTFMSAMWSLGTEFAIRFFERFGLTALACIIIAYGCTEIAKKGLKAYVFAKYTVRPWWYALAMAALPAGFGFFAGGSIGTLKVIEHSAGEGAAVGLCAGLLAYVLVKWAMKKFGIPWNESQDLSMQMRAIRPEEVPTDPVVSDPTEPIVSSDIITDKGTKQ